MSNVHYLSPAHLMMNNHDLSWEAQNAAHSLVAEAWSSGTEVLNVRIDDAVAVESGNPIRAGSWEITVRQIQAGDEIETPSA